MGTVVRVIRSLTINLLVLTFILIATNTSVYAHSGRTDANGGHNCNVGSCAGTYHYHNGGGGGDSGGLSEAAQARVAGADFARTENRARIESSAKVEGNYQGKTDGLAGTNTPYAGNDSAEHCSQEVKFTNVVSANYKEAFQTVYTRTCVSVYDDAYRTAYQTSNASAEKTYEENKAKELSVKAEQKKVEDTKNRNTLLLIGGVVVSGIAGSAMWNSYRKSTK